MYLFLLLQQLVDFDRRSSYIFVNSYRAMVSSPRLPFKGRSSLFLPRELVQPLTPAAPFDPYSSPDFFEARASRDRLQKTPRWHDRTLSLQ